MQISHSSQILPSIPEDNSVQPEQVNSVPKGFFDSYLRPFIELLRKKIGQWIHSVKVLFGYSSTTEAAQHLSLTTITQVEHPLFLRSAGNACYLASVLQMLFSQKEVREHLNKMDFSQNKKVNQFSQALKKLLNENGEETSGRALSSVRKALYASEANRTEFPPPNSPNYEWELDRQKDAASVLEVLSDMLNYKIVTKKTWSQDSVGEIEAFKPESLFVLPLDLIGEFKNNYFLDLFNCYFEKEKIESKMEINSQASENKEIKPGKKEKDAYSLNVIVNQQTKLVTLPPILPIQIKRFISDDKDSRKLDSPVILPKDGVINLSEWVDPKLKESESTNYELMGYVVHSGGLYGGHYIARVKIEDQFFECNDMAETPFKAITQKQFYQEEQAYLLLFKQLPHYSCPLRSSQNLKGLE